MEYYLVIDSDLRRLFLRTLSNIAHEAGYELDRSDIERFEVLYTTYGLERLNWVLMDMLNEYPKIFPSVRHVEQRIKTQIREDNKYCEEPISLG